jgi:sugar lactone lactonase YvrE
VVTSRAQQWTEPVTFHGEGPVWDVRSEALRCVDMLAGDVLTVRDGQVVEREHVGDVAAAWRARADGGYVVAVERGFVLVDEHGDREVVGPLWGDLDVRMNEGGCGPDGSFYCGSMHDDALPGRGSLWRLAPDRSTTRIIDDLSISNGLAFSADGGRAFFIDTPTHRVDVLTFAEPGVVTGRTVFADLADLPGQPDGLALDAEGGVWVAMWGGGTVQRIDPDGSRGDVVEIGVSQPSAVCFGGPDLDQLYVTTSRYSLTDGDEPAAGSVFVAGPGVRGADVMPFGG